MLGKFAKTCARVLVMVALIGSAPAAATDKGSQGGDKGGEVVVGVPIAFSTRLAGSEADSAKDLAATESLFSQNLVNMFPEAKVGGMSGTAQPVREALVSMLENRGPEHLSKVASVLINIELAEGIEEALNGRPGKSGQSTSTSRSESREQTSKHLLRVIGFRLAFRGGSKGPHEQLLRSVERALRHVIRGTATQASHLMLKQGLRTKGGDPVTRPRTPRVRVLAGKPELAR